MKFTMVLMTSRWLINRFLPKNKNTFMHLIIVKGVSLFLVLKLIASMQASSVIGDSSGQQGATLPCRHELGQ